MKQADAYVVVDNRSADSAQWQGVLRGITAAGVRNGTRVWAVPQSDMGRLLSTGAKSPVILAGTDVSFLRKAVGAFRSVGRRAVLAGLDAGQLGEDVSCAAPSRRAETLQLVNYLWACGRRRIALVGFGANSVNDKIRFHAALEAVSAEGLRISQRDVWLWQSDPAECFRSFLQNASQYDAVICPNDVLAICFINACSSAGIGIPQALYVASFGNTRVGRLFNPSITTMTMDMLSVGEQAFSVWSFVCEDTAGQMVFKITVPSRILIRESTCGQNPPLPQLSSAPAPDDPYYFDPLVVPLESIERCLSRRDALDLKILAALLDGLNYESICDQLFLSNGSLRYRMKKIYADLGVATRRQMEALIRSQFGRLNPFRTALELESVRNG